jgi:hypothetical protein
MGSSKKVDSGERRKYIRYACSTKVKAIIDFNPDVARRSLGKFPPIVLRRGETGPITDISEKGMAIELEHLLPEGLTIKLAIENPVTGPIVTGARVVWSKKLSGKKRGYAMGMVFRYMRKKHQRNLDKLIEFLHTIPE